MSMPTEPDDPAEGSGRVEQASAAPEPPTAEMLAVGAATDVLGVGVTYVDRRWRIVHMNRTAEQTSSAAPGQLIGRDVWEEFPAAEHTPAAFHYRRAMDAGEASVFRMFYPEPLNVWIELRAQPDPVGIKWFSTDITQQVADQQETADSRARLELVASLNADLLTATDVATSIAGIAERLVPMLADGAMVTLIDREGLRHDVSTAHRDPDTAKALQRYVQLRPNAVPPASPLGQVLATGVPVRSSAGFVASTVAPGSIRDCLLQLGDSWSLHLPIGDPADVFGALTFFFAAGRAPRPVDELVLTEIAGRIGTAVTTDRRVRTQTQLAEALQRSLLTDPPEPDHGQIVVRYLPAAQAAHVGGDWYDAFVQPGGTTMLVIGDVAGHDTAAAATMGQLRGLLRGIAAYTDAGPAEVLRGLDASVEVLMIEALATAAAVRFEQTDREREVGTTRMVWASAGHPAPLVVHADGRIEQLGSRRGDLLLGVAPSTTRTEHTTVLGRGATVLLYTDGLVEQRRSDLDADTHRLVQLVEDLRDGSLDEFCDGLLHGLVGDHPSDDVALVAVRLHDQDEPRPAEAGPQHVPASVPDEPPGG